MLKLMMATLLLVAAMTTTVFSQDPPSQKPDAWKAAVKPGERQMRVPRTLVYSRAQFKYNSQLNYLGRWVDTPLMVDPELKDEGPTKYSLSGVNFHKMSEEVVSYGMDGFACLPGKLGSGFLYEFCAQSPVPGFTLMPELAGALRCSPEVNPQVDAVIIPALNSPHALRIDGKLVVSSYGSDALPPEFWKKLFDSYRGKHGDKFIFLPHIGKVGGNYWPYWHARFKSGQITVDEVERIKGDLRTLLRNTDGLYLPAWAMEVEGERRFDTEFYRDFIIAIGKSVIAEPEFKSKYFALTARIGHENCTRIGHNLSCNGTATLRQSMETAMAANPDLIIIPEWDEQNENTSLRPTVYNSFSSKRIMRYYMSRLKNEPLSPITGDDASIPNLIISYRKTLTLGERVNIELLNVPDSDKRGDYTVELTLRDIDGKDVVKFPAVTFNTAELKEHRFATPSENFANYQLLLPELTINHLGKTTHFVDGFQYLELRGTWNWDYKWVKQPLRDILRPERAQFKQVATTKDTATFAADFAAKEELAYVEVLDQNAVVYTAQRPGEMVWRETPDQTVLAFHLQNMPNHEAILNGAIHITADGVKWLIDNSYSWPADYPSMREGNTFEFKDTRLGLSAQKFYAVLPATAAADAVVEIEISGVFSHKVPVRQVLTSGIYGVPGMGTPTLTINRFMRQAFHPPRLKSREAVFTVEILPDMPRSIIHLQAISASGKIYRSNPFVVKIRETDPTPANLTVYSDTTNAPVTIKAPSWQIPEIAYRIDPSAGTVLKCAAGRMLWGLSGGYAAQATCRGGSESRDTTAFISITSYPKDAKKSMPDVIEKDGAPVWMFDGVGTHLALPSGVIPRRSGFTLSLDVFPESAAGKQILVSNRSHTIGSLELFIEDGMLKGTFLDNSGNHKGLNPNLPVPLGKWSTLKVSYDLKDMRFEVNGQSGGKIPCPGPGRNDTTTVVGGYDTCWFKGLMRNIQVKHSVSDPNSLKDQGER